MGNTKVASDKSIKIFYITTGCVFLVGGWILDTFILEYNIAFGICAIAALVFFLLCPLALHTAKNQRKKQEAERIALEEYERKRLAKEAEKARLQKEYDDKVETFKSKYGDISKTVTFGLSSDFEDNVIFFNDAQVVIINGHDIPFNKILSFQYSEDKRVIKGRTTYRTETDNSDMFGRAGLGYLLDGNRGADIGAKTAAKNTIVHQEEDKVYFIREIDVTIDSLDTPLERIKVGSYKHQAEELRSMFTIIINRNSAK